MPMGGTMPGAAPAAAAPPEVSAGQGSMQKVFLWCHCVTWPGGQISVIVPHLGPASANTSCKAVYASCGPHAASLGPPSCQ